MDADAVSRASTTSHGEAISAIAAQFGPQFIDANGSMYRPVMRDLVFRDANARSKLEAIVHPIVQREFQRCLQIARATHLSAVLLDVPLLVESKRWLSSLDAILVVDCLPETQISRVILRNSMDRVQVRSIIAAQASRAERRAAADAVFWNEGLALSGLESAVGEWGRAFGL